MAPRDSSIPVEETSIEQDVMDTLPPQAMPEPLTLDERMETVERKLYECQATQDLTINYLQTIAQNMGLREKIQFLDKRYEDLKRDRDVG